MLCDCHFGCVCNQFTDSLGTNHMSPSSAREKGRPRAMHMQYYHTVVSTLSLRLLSTLYNTQSTRPSLQHRRGRLEVGGVLHTHHWLPLP
jgi:hypothetical protein